MHPKRYFKNKFIKKENSENSSINGKLPLSLAELPIGKNAMVVELRAQKAATIKFETLGLVPGARIKKLSAALLHGPIILEKDLTKFALGYGMAKKVIVEAIE